MPDPAMSTRALRIHLTLVHGHDRTELAGDGRDDLEAFHDDDHAAPNMAPAGFREHDHDGS